MKATTLHLALIGDYNPDVIAHQAIPVALQQAADALGLTVRTQWLETDTLNIELTCCNGNLPLQLDWLEQVMRARLGRGDAAGGEEDDAPLSPALRRIEAACLALPAFAAAHPDKQSDAK